MKQVITLTTDFGERDGYVGAMKGVLARGGATAVDIAHDLPRGDIVHAAWVVATACREFPPHTVHVVVVDPGVGGARRGVVAAAGTSLYVGPDNGVFAYLDVAWAREIRHGAEVSPTFHGRDVFAPAALVAAAEPADAIGPRVELAGRLPWGPRPARAGRIIHVDQFGNLISDLPASEAGGAIELAGRRLPILRTYEDVSPGELLAYIGSARTVEIAVRDGRADLAIVAPRGTPVVPA